MNDLNPASYLPKPYLSASSSSDVHPLETPLPTGSNSSGLRISDEIVSRMKKPFGESKQMAPARVDVWPDGVRRADSLSACFQIAEALMNEARSDLNDAALKVIEQGFLFKSTDENDKAKLFFLKAKLLYRQGNKDEAYKNALKGIALKPSQQVLRAELYLLAAETSTKLANEEGLEEEVCQNWLTSARTHILTGLKDLEKEPSKNQTLQARFYLMHASFLKKEGKIDSAIEELEKACSLKAVEQHLKNQLVEMHGYFILNSL